MNLGKQFKEGLLTNNPVLVQVIGMCSTMAITTSLFNGLGMGVAVIVILTSPTSSSPPCGRSSPTRSASPCSSW